MKIKFFKTYEIQISVTINTVLLENGHTYLFTYFFGCFHTTMAEVNSWHKLRPTKPKVFNSETLYRKSLPAPDVSENWM